MSDQIQDLQLEHYKYVTELGDWKRTHSCSELTLADNGREVCLMGWVAGNEQDVAAAFPDQQLSGVKSSGPVIVAHPGHHPVHHG